MSPTPQKDADLIKTKIKNDELDDVFDENGLNKQALLDKVEREHWKSIGRSIVKDWRLYLLLLPLLLIFLLWRYLPLYELIGAFKENTTIVGVWKRDFVGLEWFKKLMFGDQRTAFWTAFRNTFVISFYGLLFGFPMPIILALFFNEVRSNMARSLMQIATYLPKFVSMVVTTTLITLLLQKPTPAQDAGVIAKFLDAIGLVSTKDVETGIMALPQYFRSVFIISGIWESAGYDSIVFFAAVIAISPTRYEAAQIDGANKLAQMRYVVLPGMASTIIIMLILRIGGLLNVGYEKIILLYQNSTYSTADIVASFVTRMAAMAGETGSGRSNAAMASAADLLAAVLSMVMVIGANFVSRKTSETALY